MHDRLELLVRLGNASANAGRGEESARAYLDAAADVEAGLASNWVSGTAKRGGHALLAPVEGSSIMSSATDLRRRAAEQYLKAGRADQAVAELRVVLDAVSIRYPRTPLLALISLLFRWAVLRLRGLRFHERPEAEVPPRLLARIDLYVSIAPGLMVIDNKGVSTSLKWATCPWAEHWSFFWQNCRETWLRSTRGSRCLLPPN